MNKYDARVLPIFDHLSNWVPAQPDAQKDVTVARGQRDLYFNKSLTQGSRVPDWQLDDAKTGKHLYAKLLPAFGYNDDDKLAWQLIMQITEGSSHETSLYSPLNKNLVLASGTGRLTMNKWHLIKRELLTLNDQIANKILPRVLAAGAWPTSLGAMNEDENNQLITG